MDAIHERAAKHWNTRSSTRTTTITRWWQSPQIVSHINSIICGDRISGAVSADIKRLKELQPDGFARAVSIGCGEGRKEIDLLRANIVENFDLYEIAEQRVCKGRELLQKHNLEGRATFHEDLLEFTRFDSIEKYDLIYWNNSLHHMLDVDSAIAWCAHALKPGGVIYINDFVGPNRMQWPDDMLAVATRVRELLDERFMCNPHDPLKKLPTKLARPNIQRLIEDDPTECADSEAIIPAVNRYFGDVHTILTGGAIYHLALNDVLANFESSDGALLESLLLLDETLARAGMTHYGVIWASNAKAEMRL